MIVRVLSRDDVVEALPMIEAVEAMKSAFAQFSNGNVILPQRENFRFFSIFFSLFF